MSNKVLEFLTEHLKGGRSYCALSNALIGNKTNLLAKTVSRQLTELKKEGVLIITRGTPAEPGSFEAGIDQEHKGRRIYMANSPEVAHLCATMQEQKPPHPYETRYPDHSIGIVERHIRHDWSLSLLARHLYTDLVLIAAGGTCEAPLAYYAYASGAEPELCLAALEELKAAGYIWLFYDQPSNALACGTISGLFEAFTIAKLRDTSKELVRIRQIIKEHSIFKNGAGLKKGISTSVKNREAFVLRKDPPVNEVAKYL